MTRGLTPAGRAHMATLRETQEALRRLNEAERLKGDLRRIDVGWMAWERVPDDADHLGRGGVVVEKIISDDGEVTGVRCVIAEHRGDRWVCETVDLDLDAIGDCRPLGAVGVIRHWRQLFHCIASRNGQWDQRDGRLMHWAIVLRDAFKEAS